MVQGHASSVSSRSGRRSSGFGIRTGFGFFHPSGCFSGSGFASFADQDRYPYEYGYSYPSEEFKLPRSEGSGGETGGSMLNITGMNRFYYLRNFHDLRCKNSRVLSIIHQQLNRESEEDEVFIVLSKDRCKVRLFTYDRRSFSLYEKRFTSGYKFMSIRHEGDGDIYSIQWKDVVLLLQNPVINYLNIR